jgi:hypothetical protein
VSGLSIGQTYLKGKMMEDDMNKQTHIGRYIHKHRERDGGIGRGVEGGSLYNKP